MIRVLPDIEVHPPGSLTCAICHGEMRLSNFCATCYEEELQRWETLQAQRAEEVRRDFAQARKRARTWQLAKVANQ